MSVSHAVLSGPALGEEPSSGGPGDPGAAGVGWLVEMLGQIADPRDVRGIRHRIGSVLAVMVFAVLTGARNFRQVGDRAADLPQDLLRLAGSRQDRLTRRYAAPSEATMRRIAHSVDADAADRRVGAWLNAHATASRTASAPTAASDMAPEMVPGLGGALVGIAMDGKTIRNTIAPGGAPGGEIKLFSALLHQEAIVIAQLAVPAGTNETTQVTALLAGTDLAATVITGDAAHAQHATAAHLGIERGADYALTVKANQSALLDQIIAVLPPAAPGTAHHLQIDKTHGRIVHRAIWVAPADQVTFPAAAQVFRIRRDTFDHQGNRLSKEVVHGVTSLNPLRADPATIAALIRRHWAIENRSHWVRDVVFGEDTQHAYAGNGAHTMATLRNLAIALLRLAGITHITRTLERIAADRTRIIPIITNAINPA